MLRVDKFLTGAPAPSAIVRGQARGLCLSLGGAVRKRSKLRR